MRLNVMRIMIVVYAMMVTTVLGQVRLLGDDSKTTSPSHFPLTLILSPCYSLRSGGEEVDAEVVFEHHSAVFRGDRRALSSQSKDLMNFDPVPFPDNQQLFYELIAVISPIIERKINGINFESFFS